MEPVPKKSPPRPTDASKTPFRVACEQEVAGVLARASKSIWTLKELRVALRVARRRVFGRYGRVLFDGGRPYVEGGPSAWRRAIVTVAGVPWRKLHAWKQSEWEWREARYR